MPEPEATEATIHLIYKAYYAEMGGAGDSARGSRPFQNEPVDQQRHRLPAPAAANRARGPGKAGAEQKPRLPVALIFACLVVVYVGIRYYWR